jgi:hypothetical protein
VGAARTVEGCDSEHDTDRATAHPRAHARHRLPLIEAAAEIGISPKLGNHGANEVHRAVKLLLGVGGGLGNLPHEHIDNPGPFFLQLAHERLNCRDALRKRH